VNAGHVANVIVLFAIAIGNFVCFTDIIIILFMLLSPPLN